MDLLDILVDPVRDRIKYERVGELHRVRTAGAVAA